MRADLIRKLGNGLYTYMPLGLRAYRKVENIIKEDRSTTTFENLKYSKEIIDAREGNKYTVLVTSNYHVYRALRYCRRIGLKCTGVGSHTAFYYWPSALIREFIAVHAEKKHFIILVAGWLLCMMPLILSLLAK